jgi:transcriptional regulator with PAS, ATPase and Fis domain
MRDWYMETNYNEFKFLSDIIKEGLIFIDKDGIIRLYNKKAKEIFGIGNQWTVGHPSGKLDQGDFVIIADNVFGKDDGGLVPQDLKVIGIPEGKVCNGDIVLAAGCYNNEKIKPVFRCWKNTDSVCVFEMSAKFEEVDIFMRIEKNKKIIQIKVRDEEYTMNYISSIGHLVIIDKETKAVKFFQDSGYTARGEGIKNILNGSHFIEKGKASDFEVIGKNIFDIHEKGKTILEFYNASQGKIDGFKDKMTEINGFPVLCSLTPYEVDGARLGAVLQVEDISSLKKALEERDEALSYAEEIENMLDENIAGFEDFSDFLGESDEILNVKRLAYKASRTNSKVLLLGESGTGKTILANCIHKASKRKGKPFIHVNCAAMPEMLLESELFGYEKGAFTGAAAMGKEGLFRKADGGTIFLDEIGEISLSSQVKLLKVMQNKTFYKIGGTQEINVDVRVIAATNNNLEEDIKKGTFREDLYYRINVFPIIIPPLRNRKADVAYLANRLTRQICEKLELPTKYLSARFQEFLLEYDWPGNVRELENILERAINITDSVLIDIECLPFNISNVPDEKDQFVSKNLRDTLEESERKAFVEALKIANNDRKLAMETLQIGKTNFYEKMKKHQLL